MWQELFPTPPVSKSIPTGTRLLVRDAVPTDAIRLCRGRVAAGQFEEGELRHRLVAVEGPCWLDIGSVLFEKPCAADWVAETPVEVEFVAGDALRQWLAAQPATVRNLMRDSSELQRQQTESTLSSASSPVARVGDRDVVVAVHLGGGSRFQRQRCSGRPTRVTLGAAHGQPHQQFHALGAGLFHQLQVTLNCVAHSGLLSRLSRNCRSKPC
jgi:hypothetical protein